MEARIEHLDKQTVRQIRNRLEIALKPLAAELGVELDLGSCAFREHNGRFQLRVALLDINGKPITEEYESFIYNASFFGFESTDLGREFTFQGQTFMICGLKPKSRRYPVLAKSSNGTGYKFDCKTVLEALGRRIPPLQA